MRYAVVIEAASDNYSRTFRICVKFKPIYPENPGPIAQWFASELIQALERVLAE